MENIYYHERLAIQEHNVSANKNMLTIRRRRRQLPFQLPFQSGRQLILLCESRRQVFPMALVPAMHNLVIAVIIPMPIAFMAVLFVTVTLSIIVMIMIFVLVAMFMTTPVSMIFMLGKSHAGA